MINRYKSDLADIRNFKQAVYTLYALINLYGTSEI